MCEAGASAVLVGDVFTRLGAVAAEIHGDTGAPIVIFAGDIARDDERARARGDGVGAVPELSREREKT